MTRKDEMIRYKLKFLSISIKYLCRGAWGRLAKTLMDVLKKEQYSSLHSKLPQSQEKIHYMSNNKMLYLFFSGLGHRLGMTMEPEVFLKDLHGRGADVIYLMDNSNSVYQFGIEGIGKDIDEVASYLKNITKGYDKVITWGHSNGGYSAILYGLLLDADLSFAFSANTFVDVYSRVRCKDDRSFLKKNRVCKKTPTPQYLNLKKVFETWPKSNKTRYFLFYGEGHRCDFIHASEMSNLENFSLYSCDTSGHNSAQILEASGTIDRLVDGILNNKDPNEILEAECHKGLIKKFCP